MPVSIKEGALGGGSWRQIADGNVRTKRSPWDYDPNQWFIPTKAYVKIGALGTGSWRDTNYASYPNPPTAPWVNAWNYTHTETYFSGPSSGPPVQDYHVERLDYWGNPVEGYYQTTGARTWSTPQDTQHQFRVRSRGVNGLHSAWAGNLRVGIGHPETYNYGWVQRTRGWQAQANGGVWGRDAWIAMVVPNNVYINSFQYNIYTPQDQWLYSQHRQLFYIFANNQYGDPIYWPSPWLYTDYWGSSLGWGQGAYWGLVPRGSGWGTSNPYYMIQGDFWINGTEYYDNWEIVSTNPGQTNYYW